MYFCDSRFYRVKGGRDYPYMKTQKKQPSKYVSLTHRVDFELYGKQQKVVKINSIL